MNSNNPIVQLAMHPFQNGAVDVATLARFVDACVAQPPLQPLPEQQAYSDILDGIADGGQHTSVPFQSFLLLLCFLLAELWADNRLVAVLSAHRLWETIEGDPVSADLIAALLPGLEQHPAYGDKPDTRVLVSGLQGLLALTNPAEALSEPTLERLDQGLVFTGSGFVHHQLQGLLWTRCGPSPSVLTWESLLERRLGQPEGLATELQAIYPRALFALRYHCLVKELLGSQGRALAANDRDAKEVLATPGLDCLTPAEQAELQAYSGRIHQGALEFLNSCIQLLNRANALLHQDDSWALACPVKMVTAELCLWGFALTGNQEFLREGRGFALRAAWPIRHSIPLYFDGCRHLLAKIYRAWAQSLRAQKLWQGMLHHLERYRGQDWYADLAAGTCAQLAQLAMEQDQVAIARDYALAALDHAGHHLGGGGVGDDFNLEDWSAALLDTAIAACISSGAEEQALGIFEQWYSAGALSRHLELPPVDAATLRKNLPESAALVYLCLDQQGASLLLVTASEGVKGWRQEFCWNDLQQAIGPWLKAIWQLRSASPAQGLERLRNVQAAMNQTLCGLTPLVQPLAKALQRRQLRQVVLIPGRGLGGLPLHAVPLKAGEYFGDRFALLYAPNATVWLAATRAQAARAQQGGFVGFATADSGFSAEIAQAASLWGSTAAPRLNATPAQFLQAAAQNAVLHLSCHGWFRIAETQAGMPEVDAGLLLGGGRLDWRNLLQRLRLPRARLVVLSACESLLLSHREILNQQFGLPYAFLAAGAPLLLGSSWMVESTATALLVTRFHHNIRHQYQPASLALAEAQRWLRGLARTQVEDILAAGSGAKMWIPEGERPYQHPYWWAGFRLIGAELREPPRLGAQAGAGQGGEAELSC